MRARFRRLWRRFRHTRPGKTLAPGTVEALDPGIKTALDGFRG